MSNVCGDQTKSQLGCLDKKNGELTCGLVREQEACRASLVGGFPVCLSQEGESASWVGPAVLQAWMVCDLA